jgi:hypothetical protein
MAWQLVRSALLAGVLATTATVPARAEDSPPAAPAPQYRTVCVTEWVPETYQCTRTAYRTECKQETYTAYRCECVPETRTRTCTVYKKVPEVRTETRTVCVSVPHVEERTVMQTYVTCKPETVMVRTCVDRGHWECKEVPCEPSCRDHFKGMFHHKKQCGDCCEPCEPCPPKMKTVKVWIPEKVWEEKPVTCMKRICEQRPVTCKVTVCKTEQRQESYQVTCWKCVPEQRTETYTVMTTRSVPYQATRTVKVCVPYTETVTATRCVPKTVEKQVPVTTCCASPCCESACCGSKHHGHHRGAGLSMRHHGCCD